jgi:hypothetical protein
MSALLNLNPIPLISWKGQTFNQIHSSIQKNGQQMTGNPRLYAANPLKIYRREIASTKDATCNNSYGSLKVDVFNRPGGTINNTSAHVVNDLVNVLDNTLPNNTCEKYEYSECSVVLTPAQNARNRVRSSGMIKRKFNEGRNNDTYYTSSSQYLTSRNLTFAQNQYNYIRQGDSTAKPGTSLASANVYSPHGINHCKSHHITQDTSFSYTWVNRYDNSVPPVLVPDPMEYNVTVPSGYYTLEDLNRRLKQTMFQNHHYFIKGSAGNSQEYYNDNISYALQFAYNNNTNVIEIQSYRIDATLFPPETYTVPIPIENPVIANWGVVSTDGLFPQIIVADNIFKNAIGFTAGSYPSEKTTNADMYQVFMSSFSPGIKPLYVKLYYKPNNPQFAQQGGVSSSDLITRKKYNSITNSTAAYRTAFGNEVANALAYGVPSNGYTVKDKLGYPMKKTPTFTKYSNEMKQCTVTTFANAI